MSFTSREFRDALGQFATGVCVITANPPGETPFGMTVNSFASVSLDPPLVLWSLQKDSECAPAFASTKQFAVNILKSDQEAVSNRYAKKGAHSLDAGTFRQGRSGCVVLKESLTCFECDIEARHDGGDHIILIGRVLEMQNSPTGKPLLFHAGKYGELR